MDREESIDLNRPSLFELLAEGQLRDLLHPVVRYVLSYLAQRYPRYLLRLLNHHEEVFAALLLGIEHHHLRKHSEPLEHSLLTYLIFDVRRRCFSDGAFLWPSARSC